MGILPRNQKQGNCFGKNGVFLTETMLYCEKSREEVLLDAG